MKYVLQVYCSDIFLAREKVRLLEDRVYNIAMAGIPAIEIDRLVRKAIRWRKFLGLEPVVWGSLTLPSA